MRDWVTEPLTLGGVRCADRQGDERAGSRRQVVWLLVGHPVEFDDGVPVAGGGAEGQGFFGGSVGWFGFGVAAEAVKKDFLAHVMKAVAVGGDGMQVCEG